MCHWISLKEEEEKGRNLEFELVQSGSSCAMLDLGVRKSIGLGMHMKTRVDTPLSFFGFHVLW